MGNNDPVRRSDLHVVVSVASSTELIQKISTAGVDLSRIIAVRVTARPKGALIQEHPGPDENHYYALEAAQAEALIDTLRHALAEVEPG
jgi:hypothetical protein